MITQSTSIHNDWNTGDCKQVVDQTRTDQLFAVWLCLHYVPTTTRIECEVENWSQRERLKAPCHHSPVANVSLYWLAPPILSPVYGCTRSYICAVDFGR